MQRLSNPRLITDSMASGGVPRERYSMGAPGSAPIDDYTMPAAAGFNDLGDVGDATTPDRVDRNLLGPDGSPRDPMDSPFPDRDPESGRYTGTGGDPWKSAGTSDGGWQPV